MWPFIPNIQKLLEKRNVTGILAALAYKHPVVREAAAKALGEVGDSRATEGLCSALKDSHSKVRQAAANALGADWRNASRPSSLCGFERARRRRARSRGEGACEDWPICCRSSLATLKDGNDLAREAAVAALVNIGRAALEPLCQSLTSTDAKTRQFAAKALVKMVGEVPDLAKAHTPTCEATCIAALQDTSAEVRNSAARLLGRMRCRGSADALAKLLESADPSTRYAAARSLMELGDARGDRLPSRLPGCTRWKAARGN